MVVVFAGIILTSASDMTFNIAGALAALASAIGVSVQAVMTKRALLSGAGKPFLWINLAALALFLPIWVAQDAAPLFSAATSSSERPLAWGMLLYSGLALCSQDLAAYIYLQEVSAGTHAVTNGLRGVVVIICSAVYFNNAIQPIGALGIAMTIGGVMAYGVAKQKKQD